MLVTYRTLSRIIPGVEFYEGVAGRVGRLRTTHGPHAVL